MILDIKTFILPCSDKEQAVKVLEEAAEAFGAWQVVKEQEEWLGEQGDEISGYPKAAFSPNYRPLADEIADVIQAACNLAARYNLDMQAAMERCEERNRDRGRYEGR